MIQRTSGFSRRLRWGRGSSTGGLPAAILATILLTACAQVQLGLPGGEAEAPPKSETGTEAPADAADAAGAEPEGTETSESAPSDAAETPPEAETAAPPDTGTAARLPAPDEAPAEPDAGDAQAEQAPERIELEEPKGEPLRQTVGLLLPLSGPKAALGATMLRAAELAMFDVAGERFDLVVRDTKGTPDGAEAAAREAIDAGANLLLGPVFASSVKAVKPVAKGGQVPILAFSNNPSVAEPGAYVMGLMPAQQVRRVVSYAVRQGRRHYAVLAPRNAYGQLVVQSLRAATRRYGGTLHHVAFYPPGSQDVSDEVKAVANAGFGEREGAAVMLPAGGKQLQTLAPTLPFFDIDPDKVRFLGTTLWNDPGLGTEPSLVGGWFAAPPPDQRDTFRRRYRAAFASDPGELASLAYDATALASLLARRNARDGNPLPAAFTEEKLTQTNGFAGVDGIFRLNRDGTVRRLYAVLEMQRNNLEVVDPAPTRFEPRVN